MPSQENKAISDEILLAAGDEPFIQLKSNEAYVTPGGSILSVGTVEAAAEYKIYNCDCPLSEVTQNEAHGSCKFNGV